MSCNNNLNSYNICKILKSCKCVQKNNLDQKLSARKKNLKNNFDEWETIFKLECMKNGKYSSYADYLENHQDFKKPAFITLRQSDFDVNPVSKLILGKNLGGTLRIVASSYFELGEDITFNFNEDNNFIPTVEQTTKTIDWKNYPQSYIYPVRQNNGSYDLGFFAGITVEANNVVIDLNKKTLKMSDNFYFMQRFFSLIEFASSPFIPKQGPGNFGDKVNFAENLIIKDGRLGLSSHNGVHGNNNNHVYLHNLEIIDFEIAGIALNDVDDFLCLENNVRDNFKKVPVKGNAAFLVFAVRVLKTLNNKKEWKKVYECGEAILNRIYNDYQSGKKIEYPLGNDSGLSDGLTYGIVINNKGVAVNGFSACCESDIKREYLSQNVFVENSKITQLAANPEEVVSIAKEGKPVVMGFGSILRLKELTDINSDKGYPKRNPFSNFVFLLAKTLNNNKEYARLFSPGNLYIEKWIIDWYFSEDQNIFKLVQEKNYELYCNADTMNHVQKGTIGVRLQGVLLGLINNVELNDIENYGEYGSEMLGDYVKSHLESTLENYGGNICRGFAISNSEDLLIKNCLVRRVLSRTGSAYGVDTIQKNISKIYFENNKVDQVITLSNKVKKGNRYPESRYFTFMD